MRRTLAAAYIAGVSAVALCSSAYAADLRRPPPPVMMPAIPMWTGFYFGGHFGGVATHEDANDGVTTLSPDPNGVLGGLQAGYNYQVAPNWLIGIEGELSWTNANGTTDVFHSQHNWYDTLDGRLGYVMGSWMGYVKGGVAWMNADYSIPVGGLSLNTTRTGWNVGIGAEYMIAPQWSAKAEYNFLDFGTDNLGFPLTGASVNTKVNEFKVGVNYHWMPGTLFGRW